MRALRTLAPVRPINARRNNLNQRLRNAAFILGLFAVILQFTITLTNLGVDYTGLGGNLLVKLHPATFLLFIAAFMLLVLQRPAGSGIFRLCHDTPALALFNVLCLFCALYAVVNVGLSGATVYIESFLAAGLLAIALEGGTDGQKRALAWSIVGLCSLSGIISTMARQVSDNPDSDGVRGAGFFGDPATAALATSMAVFLLLRMRMNGFLKAMLLTILAIGLLEFGSATAFATTLGLTLLAAVAVLLRGLVMRDLSIGVVGRLGAAILLVPPVLFIVLTGTDIGEQILAHIRPDDGAGLPSWQLLVLNHLDMHDVLFGVSPDRLDVLKYQITLGQDMAEPGNFWLRTFLDLGAIWFAVLLLSLALFVVHLGRRAAVPLGWMLVFATGLIDTIGNCTDGKRVDLFFLAACMIAMTGYARTRSSVHLPQRTFLRLASDRPTFDRLGTRPPHAHLAGFH